MCSICETTGGSCRGPANYQGVAMTVPTKGMISFAGSFGANPYQDRPGIMCRTVKDTATILDAFRDKKTGSYFDAHDPYTALPRVVPSATPYVSAVSKASTSKPLAGMRIGVIRALFVKPTPGAAAVSDGINRELKVLQSLGAELVEDVDPEYPDDPSIPNMTFGFNDAFAEVLPFHMPEIFSWKKDGKPMFSLAGWDITSRKYLVALSAHKAPLPEGMNFRTVFANPPNNPDEVTGYTFAFQLGQYLTLRGDSRVYDWQTLNANAKYFNDVRRAAMKNWENKEMDIRTGAIAHTMKRRDTLRMAMTKVLLPEQDRCVREPGEPHSAGQDRRRAGAHRRWRRRRRFRIWRHARHSGSLRPGGLRGQHLRLRVRAQRGQQELRGQGERDADEARWHRPAVQRGVLGGAGPGSGAAEGGCCVLRLRLITGRRRRRSVP